MVKNLKLEGFGTIVLTPLNIKEQSVGYADIEGKEVKSVTEGTRTTKYVNSEGVEIPRKELRKKFIIEDEEVILKRLEQTKEINNEDIEITGDNSIMYNGIERKFYKIFTDSKKISDLVLKQKKSLMFNLIVGQGWRMWNAILTYYKDSIILVCCRGNVNTALDVFADDICEFEIELIPQKEQIKKLATIIC